MSLLPPNATPLERRASDALAIDLPVDIAKVWSADDVPVDLLPWLAWGLQVDFWDVAQTEAQRRELVKNAIPWHKKRGTPYAIKKALELRGYPVVEIIEYQQYIREWEAAGGLFLDGSWTLDDGAVLNPPVETTAGNVALGHWTEYALKINTIDSPWTTAQQRLIRSVAEAYAGVRDKLQKIIVTGHASFDSRIRLISVTDSAHTDFAGCRRAQVHSWDVLDGCRLIGGYETPRELDGSWCLDGVELNGIQLQGDFLDSGFYELVQTIKSEFAFSAAGGDRVEPTRHLSGVGFSLLDGRWTLGALSLRGTHLVDGQWAIEGPYLQRIEADRLDGTWHLVEQPDVNGIWFDLTVTVIRGGMITKEVW